MRRFVVWAVVLSATLVAGGFLLVAVKTERTLRRSRLESADEARLAFELSDFHRVASQFSQLGAASGYTSAVVFQGNTVLAGADGLTIGTPGQADARQLRMGVDLPAAPITGLAVGVLRGDARPRLIVATRGAGLLFLDDANGGTIRQLRPQEAGLRDVTAVAVMASGELLIGTRDKGLLRYDGKTLEYFNPALTGVPVTAIAANEAEFWVGTRDRGAFRWHAGQLDHFDRDSGMPDGQVESIALKDGRAFVGTPLGVAEFDGGRSSHVLAKGFFAHAVAVDRERLVVGSIDQGILSVPLSDEAKGRKAIRGDVADGVRAESFVAADGELFAVTAGGLARHENAGGWTTVRSEDAAQKRLVLADRNVSALSFTPDGALWVGYFDHGLDVVNLATGAVRHTEDDHVFCVNRIVTDAGRGTVDVATANGLVLFDGAGRERQVMMRRDGLIADQVTDVAFTKDGTVLATPAGITFIDAGGVSSLYGFQGLVNNHVYALASDAASGTLLAGTLGGISVLGSTAVLRDAVVRRNLTTKNSGLKQNWITAIVAVPDSDAKAGQRWFVGTYGGGVVELGADGQFAAMDGAISEAGRAMVINPNAMLVTEQHVFAGSLGDGLFVYDRASRRWSQVKAGLPSLNVTAMAERDGELYVGTENGVVHIAEARLAP
jgi:ligand-binding sensor domain-containing protein